MAAYEDPFEEFDKFSNKFRCFNCCNETIFLEFNKPKEHKGRHGNDNSGGITFEGFVTMISKDGKWVAYANDKWLAFGPLNSEKISTGGSMDETRWEAGTSNSPWAKRINEIRICYWQYLHELLHDRK